MNGGLVKTWKDLEVWQLAHSLVLRIYNITNRFPVEERYRITDQLCRASSSIPTNIAEGKGRSSIKGYIRFLVIARGSLEEVKYLLLLSKDLNYLDGTKYDEFIEDYTRVHMMLNKLISSLKSSSYPNTEYRNTNIVKK